MLIGFLMRGVANNVKDESVPSKAATSLSLLDQARHSAPDAWRTLKELYQPAIYRWCTKGGLRDGSVQDVAQEVLKRVFEHLPDFEHPGVTGSFRAWVRRITARAVADWYRKNAREMARGGSTALGEINQIPDQRPLEHPDDRDLSEERALLYRRAWEMIRGEFTDRDCEIFRRVAENQEKPKDVAADMRLTRATVYMVVNKIKTCLRNRFADVISGE